jgi:hypothetical protein
LKTEITELIKLAEIIYLKKHNNIMRDKWKILKGANGTSRDSIKSQIVISVDEINNSFRHCRK